MFGLLNVSQWINTSYWILLSGIYLEICGFQGAKIHTDALYVVIRDAYRICRSELSKVHLQTIIKFKVRTVSMRNHCDNLTLK